jgi:RES domain-containing protein
VKAKYQATAFDGEGARRFGGRWNTRGIRLTYTAGSQALAVLEMLVHLKSADILKHYRLIPVTFDQVLIRNLDVRKLPISWRRRPAPAAIRALGDAWVAEGKSVVLQVPSVIVPGESNYLINVVHPDFLKLQIGRALTYRFDPRLK